VTPRIPAREPADFDDAARTALERFVGPDITAAYLSDDPASLHMPNVVATLMQHPALAQRWLAYNNVLLREPKLSDRERELIILRVAARTRSTYEWIQHVRIGRDAGITDAEIEAIAAGGAADSLTTVEAALVAAADELLDDYVVGDATWAVLAAHYDVQQLTELLFVAGSYTCLAMVFKSAGIELDPDLLDVNAPEL